MTSDDRSAVNPGGSTDGLGFAEMLAVCDPSAVWFEAWMSSARPRDQLINYAWQSGIVLHLVAHALDHCPDAASMPLKPGATLNSSSHDHRGHKDKVRIEANALRLLQSLSMLATLLEYKEGRRALKGRAFYRDALSWRQNQRRKGHRNAPQKNSNGYYGDARTCSMPEEVETVPLRCTNNLIRACCRGALWRSAHVGHCECLEMGSNVRNLDSMKADVNAEEKSNGKGPPLPKGFVEAESDMEDCDGGVDLSVNTSTAGWWIAHTFQNETAGKDLPAGEDMVTTVLKCFAFILSRLGNAGREMQYNNTSPKTSHRSNVLSPELRFLLSHSCWRQSLGEIIERVLSSTALSIDGRDLTDSNEWPFLLSNSFIAEHCFPLTFPSLPRSEDRIAPSSDHLRIKPKQSSHVYTATEFHSFSLITRVSANMIKMIGEFSLHPGWQSLLLQGAFVDREDDGSGNSASRKARNASRVLQKLIDVLRKGLSFLSALDPKHISSNSGGSKSFSWKIILVVRESVKRYLVASASLLRNPLASETIGRSLFEPLVDA